MPTRVLGKFGAPIEQIHSRQVSKLFSLNLTMLKKRKMKSAMPITRTHQTEQKLSTMHGQRGMKRGAAEKMRRPAAPRLVWKNLHVQITMLS